MINFLSFHLSFILQALTVLTIGLVLYQIKVADELDQIRWGNDSKSFLLIEARRTVMIFKVAALIWIVVYTDNQHWQPWPPFIAFIAAFDLYVLVNLLILRKDRNRLRERMKANGMAVRRL